MILLLVLRREAGRQAKARCMRLTNHNILEKLTNQNECFGIDGNYNRVFHAKGEKRCHVNLKYDSYKLQCDYFV